ncbi:MAG: hypothetical protein Q4F83_10250 [Eubacteriales bacterium]|nr:hypothetical protein [Eubacteriales bacterium]
MKSIRMALTFKLAALFLGILISMGFCPVKTEASAKVIGLYSVKVDSGYLALRNEKAYDSSNEIGKLYTGDYVLPIGSTSSSDEYWYVYSYDQGKLGYVNSSYLVYEGRLKNEEYYDVKVDSGYLALRKEKAYDSSNEIGKLYTGDSVLLLNDSDSSYWIVYSPDLMKAGYVNKDYLK